MKILVSTPILDAEDKPVKDGVRFKMCEDGRTPFCDPATGEPVVVDPGYEYTFRHAFNRALGPQQEDAGLNDDEKLKIFRLHLKIAKGGEVDLTADEVVLLKKRVSKAFNPLIYGRVCEFLGS